MTEISDRDHREALARLDERFAAFERSHDELKDDLKRVEKTINALVHRVEGGKIVLVWLAAIGVTLSSAGWALYNYLFPHH